MSHVTRISETCHTHLWVMSHVSQWVMSHILVRHVTQVYEPCHTYQWVVSRVSVSHVTRMNESCQSQVCGSHVIDMNKSRSHDMNEWRDVTHAYPFTWLIQTHDSFILIHTHSYSFTGMNESYSFILIHTHSYSFILNEYECVTYSFILIHTHTYAFIRIHRYEWVMSHVWISHVKCVNEPYHTRQCSISHIWRWIGIAVGAKPVYEVTRSHVWHDSPIFGTQLFNICNLTRSGVRHG